METEPDGEGTSENKKESNGKPIVKGFLIIHIDMNEWDTQIILTVLLPFKYIRRHLAWWVFGVFGVFGIFGIFGIFGKQWRWWDRSKDKHVRVAQSIPSFDM